MTDSDQFSQGSAGLVDRAAGGFRAGKSDTNSATAMGDQASRALNFIRCQVPTAPCVTQEVGRAPLADGWPIRYDVK
jgi:hypothetical protein